jgi:predicted DCC family thiol-disulfide oxidoreductase YuxK
MTLRVLYNGACPICAREIAHYRALAARHGADLAFDDLNTTDLAAWGLTPDQAMRRLHARAGSLRLAGLAAFRGLWERLPGWRWLAWLTGLPGIRQAADWSYERIAAPWLYRRSCRAGACRVA